jgi:hypothetical protein
MAGDPDLASNRVIAAALCGEAQNFVARPRFE